MKLLHLSKYFCFDEAIDQAPVLIAEVKKKKVIAELIFSVNKNEFFGLRGGKGVASIVFLLLFWRNVTLSEIIWSIVV